MKIFIFIVCVLIYHKKYGYKNLKLEREKNNKFMELNGLVNAYLLILQVLMTFP